VAAVSDNWNNGWLVATTTCTLDLDGEDPLPVKQGMTRVRADDEFAWAYPQVWKPLDEPSKPKLVRVLPHRRARRRGRRE
jgi:hypothetical protein